MDFAEFTTLLPTPTHQTTIEEGGAILRASGLPGFVAPSLNVRNAISPLRKSGILIISAPGAVGKTTLARQLSASTQWPIWDLAAEGPIGKNSLIGALTHALGPSAIGSYLQSLKIGNGCLIIDAMDEARIKITDEAFSAFLHDIATLSGGNGYSFVLFGRTQIAETAWLNLESLQASPTLINIEMFTRTQAEEYVEKKVRSLRENQESLDAHYEPFVQARTKMFELLEDATKHDPSSAFIGYAPVLDAMAVRLSEISNFGEAKQQLERLANFGHADKQHRPAALLRQVCEDILGREQDAKLLKSIKPTLEPIATAQKWNGIENLYSAKEQCERLVCRLTKRSTANVTPDLPLAIKAKYEEQVSTFLPEHPFLVDGNASANAVFDAYLLARALFESQETQQSAEQLLKIRTTGSTRLLADFYFLLLSERKGDLVPQAHIAPLYRSFSAAVSANSHANLYIDEGNNDSDFGEGEFTLCTHLESDGTEQIVEFNYEFRTRPLTLDSIIPFSHQLADADITVPCTVSLDAPQGEFEIGPSVRIECGRLNINAQKVTVAGERRAPGPQYADDSSVEIRTEAASVDGVASLAVRGNLQVSWPNSNSYPWTAYNFTDNTAFAAPGDASLSIAFKRFRRIALTFRSHSKGALRRLAKKIEHQRVLKGAIGEVLLKTMIADGILVRMGGFYEWKPEVAASHVGVSWQDLKLGRATEKTREYLSEFIANNPNLFS